MMLFFYTCPNLSCNDSCILLLDEAVSWEIHEIRFVGVMFIQGLSQIHV